MVAALRLFRALGLLGLRVVSVLSCLKGLNVRSESWRTQQLWNDTNIWYLICMYRIIYIYIYI